MIDLTHCSRLFSRRSLHLCYRVMCHFASCDCKQLTAQCWWVGIVSEMTAELPHFTVALCPVSHHGIQNSHEVLQNCASL